MNLFKKIQNKFEHIRTGNKYRGCEICNGMMYKNPQPVIYTYEIKDNEWLHQDLNIFDGHYIQMFFCRDCWNKLSVEERITYYLERLNEKQDRILIIKNICKESGVKPDRYIRKLKLEEIGI